MRVLEVRSQRCSHVVVAHPETTPRLIARRPVPESAHGQGGASSLRSMLIIGATSVALIAPLTPPADATPRPPAPATTASQRGDDGGSSNDRRTLSQGRQDKIHVASSIYRKATEKNGKVLNYNKAKKYDLSDARARRQFAAVYLWAGRKITHLSKGERAKVKAATPKAARKVKPHGLTTPATASGQGLLTAQKLGGSPFPKKCTGISKVVAYNQKGPKFENYIWLNSCETRSLELWMSIAAGAAGVMALVSAPSGAGPVLFGVTAAALVAGKEYVTKQKEDSSVSAVIVVDRTYILEVWSQ